MMMCTLCTRFVRTTVRARLSLLDKMSVRPLDFTRLSLRNHIPKMLLFS